MELNGWAYSDKAGKMTTSAGITVSEEEIERLKQLRAWWAKSHAGGQGQTVDGPGASSSSPSKAKRGAILLKDVEIGNFITATVKVSRHTQRGLMLILDSTCRSQHQCQSPIRSICDGWDGSQKPYAQLPQRPDRHFAVCGLLHGDFRPTTA